MNIESSRRGFIGAAAAFEVITPEKRLVLAFPKRWDRFPALCHSQFAIRNSQHTTTLWGFRFMFDILSNISALFGKSEVVVRFCL